MRISYSCFDLTGFIHVLGNHRQFIRFGPLAVIDVTIVVGIRGPIAIAIVIVPKINSEVKAIFRLQILVPVETLPFHYGTRTYESGCCWQGKICIPFNVEGEGPIRTSLVPIPSCVIA